MIGFASRTHALWMIVVLIALPARVGSAQIFARVSHDAAAAANAACGFRPCPPKALTYGYYHENWRRWPEESPIGQLGELSPFVVPDRTAVPAVETPDPRDEGSGIFRRRSPVSASPQDAQAPMPSRSAAPMPTTPSGPAAETLQPMPGVEGTDPLDAVLPGPSDPLAMPGAESDGLLLPDFPESQESLPDLQPTPDPSTPATTPDAPAPAPGSDDPFDDLDSLDFGQHDGDAMPPLSRTTHRRATGPLAIPVAQASHVVELAGERSEASSAEEESVSTSTGRGNPLRPKVKAHYASQRKPQALPAPSRIRPARMPKTEPRPSSGRANPLRGR